MDNTQATIVGAFLAAGFGIASTLFLEFLRGRARRRLSAEIIAREIAWILDRRAKALDRSPGLVHGKFLPMNSLAEQRSTALSLLSPAEMSTVETAYATFEMYDRLQENAIHAKALGREELAAQYVELYWSSLSVENTAVMVGKLQAIVDKLERLAGRAVSRSSNASR